MRQNNTPPPAPDLGKGYQPLREGYGYQPAQALNSTPPQGGSGLPSPTASTGGARSNAASAPAKKD
jgi:hypothetical protein